MIFLRVELPCQSGGVPLGRVEYEDKGPRLAFACCLPISAGVCKLWLVRGSAACCWALRLRRGGADAAPDLQPRHALGTGGIPSGAGGGHRLLGGRRRTGAGAVANRGRGRGKALRSFAPPDVQPGRLGGGGAGSGGRCSATAGRRTLRFPPSRCSVWPRWSGGSTRYRCAFTWTRGKPLLSAVIAMGGKENALTDRCGDATISCIVKRPSGEKKPRIEVRSVYPMKCPYCANLESKVVDSRPADEGPVSAAEESAWPAESVSPMRPWVSLPLVVVKRTAPARVLTRTKCCGGMIRACEKRPVAMETLVKIADAIEQELQNALEQGDQHRKDRRAGHALPERCG